MKKENIILTIVSVILVGIFVYSLFFTTPKYNVTINAGDGSEAVSLTVKKFKKVEKPADPVKEGYTFLGWYVDDQEYNFDTEVLSDLDIEARFEEIITTTTTKNTKKTTKKKK